MEIGIYWSRVFSRLIDVRLWLPVFRMITVLFVYGVLFLGIVIFCGACYNGLLHDELLPVNNRMVLVGGGWSLLRGIKWCICITCYQKWAVFPGDKSLNRRVFVMGDYCINFLKCLTKSQTKVLKEAGLSTCSWRLYRQEQISILVLCLGNVGTATIINIWNCYAFLVLKVAGLSTCSWRLYRQERINISVLCLGTAGTATVITLWNCYAFLVLLIISGERNSVVIPAPLTETGSIQVSNMCFDGC